MAKKHNKLISVVLTFVLIFSACLSCQTTVSAKSAIPTLAVVTAQAHVFDIGWQGWKSNGQLAGTTGRALAMEAVQIKLSGNYSRQYDICYRAHVQDVG